MAVKHSIRVAVLIFMLPVLCFLVGVGCVNVRTIESGKKWDDNLLFLIKSGETKATDVAYAFGSPEKEIIGKNGRIWIYKKGTYKYECEGNARRALLESEDYSFTVWFNADGVVVNYSLSYNSYESPYIRSPSETLQNQESSERGAGK